MLPAFAGVTAERTRIIFDENDREGSVLLVNQNPYPVLTQVWVDDGEIYPDPTNSRGPVLPLPPIFRLFPGEQRTIRLIKTGQPTPSDRESLYWFNIYEIPPKNNQKIDSNQAKITVTLRTQLKLLYRPKDLKEDAEHAPRKIVFRKFQTNNSKSIKIENPTPFYITITGAKPYQTNKNIINSILIPPFGVIQTPPLHEEEFENIKTIDYSWIDDGGNIDSHSFEFEE